MPAEKATRQSVRRHQRNHSTLSATRTALTSARRAMDSGDTGTAETAVRHAFSVLDRAAKKGALHKNNASRRKARLVARLNKIKEGTT